VDALMKKGVGLACLHYAVEPAGRNETHRQKSWDRFRDWIGGYFEIHWSVNPHWDADFKQLPEHPITRGVKPFRINDEWYFNMRFEEGMSGVTPILAAVPPDEVRNRPDGPHSGNSFVRSQKGREEIVAWARERPGGGRGFGFTGGHVHWNWGHDDFRKVVLNAIVWITGAEVPPEGVPSRTPTREELEENQDFPKPEKRA
jgi:type 1 glutamine amidotransferase